VKRYLVSADASADLEAIWHYIAERSEAETSTEFLGRFYETFRSIAASPRARVNMPDLPGGDVRKFPMGNYLIYYRARPGKTVIVRILHGKRVQRRAFREKR